MEASRKGTKRRVSRDEDEDDGLMRVYALEDGDVIDSDSEDSDGVDLDEEGDKDAFGEVQVDFEFFDPEEQDYHIIKRFLQEMLNNEIWNASEMADLIVKLSPYVGTVVRVGEETVGLLTVINIHKYREMESVSQVVNYLIEHAPSEEARTSLVTALEDTEHPLGLILSLRMINVPSQLAPHLHKTLYKEIGWAREHELSTPATSGENSWGFSRYLLLSSVFTEGQGDKSSAPRSKKGKTGDELVYHKPEEQIYREHAEWSFVFPISRHNLASWWTFSGVMSGNGMVVCIPASATPAIIEGVHKMCSEDPSAPLGE